MKIIIKEIPKPEFKHGGEFNQYPYAGDVSGYRGVLNPFGLINSDTETDYDNISSTIKAVDREKANAEYEKGEIVMKFDLGGMYKVAGKPHSQGGTPVIADNGDFVFSNDKDLAITKEEKKQFDFDSIKSAAKKENTPAKILSKEIDVKHYNQMAAILQDPKSDKIAKATAQLMLQKYIEKAGQVAFLQEAKKDFPQGTPTFSEGTAPVKDPEVAIAPEIEKMYARYGGKMRFKDGGPYDKYLADYLKSIGVSDTPANSDPYGFRRMAEHIKMLDAAEKGEIGGGGPGRDTSFGRDRNTNPNDPYQLAPFTASGQPGDGSVERYYQRNFGYNPTGNVADWQNFMATNAQTQPGLLNYLRSVPLTNKGMREASQFGNNTNSANASDAQLLSSFQDGRFKYRAPRLTPTNTSIERTGLPPSGPMTITGGPTALNQNPQQPTAPGVVPPARWNGPTTPFQGYDIPFNGMEMATTAAPFLTAFAQPTYYDMLQQRHTPYVRLDRQNNEQELANIQQQGALATRELFSNMRAPQASAQAANLIARNIQAQGQSNANLRNANSQIANQETMYNAQTQRADTDFNLANIRQTYTNNVRAQQLRNEQLANGFTQSLNNATAIQGRLDDLNQTLTASTLPYLTNVYLDANGEVVGQGDFSQLSPEQQGRVVSATQQGPIGLGRNRLPYATGFGSLNSVPSNSSQGAQDMVLQIAQQYIQAGASPDAAVRSAAYTFGQMYRPNATGQSAMTQLLANAYRRPTFPQ